ncbi:MAG: hypothetical protein AAF585_11435, partial [Verrucomicrobiota bacterium]
MNFKKILKYWPRNWAGLIALGTCIPVALGCVLLSIYCGPRRATIDWVKKSGGDFETQPSWLSKRLPTGAPRDWLDKKLGSDWSKPFERVTRVR